MSVKKVFIIVGTRPNFIKVTQFKRVARQFPQLEFILLHTGQHFDEKMADVFFRQFNLIPDVFMNVPQGSPNTQMAEIMLRLEEQVKIHQPALMIVVGDVNSTFAAALTANKMNIPIAHLESGLRSFDRSMPEEHNRILTDAITDYFFVTEQSGNDHLLKEGKPAESIHFVGNTMIDTMVAFKDEIEASDVMGRYGLNRDGFVLMTMHRPATVDNIDGLNKLSQLIKEVTANYKIIFPIHPRTVKMLQLHEMYEDFSGNPSLILTEPLDYFAFQKLIKNAKFILTDSGGIQEESTFLQVPCLTLRPNTERPVTVTLGTNELLPFDLNLIREKIKQIESGAYKKGNIPPLWDGKATDRVVQILDSVLNPKS